MSVCEDMPHDDMADQADQAPPVVPIRIPLGERIHPDLVKGQLVRDITLGIGLPSISDLRAELGEYWDVLLGRKPSPIEAGVLTLMELANAYYSRAMEIDAQIHQLERDGGLVRGNEYGEFRTGELRDFIEVARKSQDLGSRRLTAEQLLLALKDGW